MNCHQKNLILKNKKIYSIAIFYSESKEALNKIPCIFCSEDRHIPSQCKKITKFEREKKFKERQQMFLMFGK